VADEHHARLRAGPAQRRTGIGDVEAFGERRVLLQAIAQRPFFAFLGGEFGGGAGAHLRAVEHEVELDPERGERAARRAGLQLAPSGQTAL